MSTIRNDVSKNENSADVLRLKRQVDYWKEQAGLPPHKRDYVDLEEIAGGWRQLAGWGGRGGEEVACGVVEGEGLSVVRGEENAGWWLGRGGEGRGGGGGKGRWQAGSGPHMHAPAPVLSRRVSCRHPVLQTRSRMATSKALQPQRNPAPAASSEQQSNLCVSVPVSRVLNNRPSSALESCPLPSQLVRAQAGPGSRPWPPPAPDPVTPFCHPALPPCLAPPPCRTLYLPTAAAVAAP